MPKVIFILIDGLNAKSTNHMGFMAACTEQTDFSITSGCLHCELPPVSRPIYATLFTGLPPLKTGITANNMWQLPQNILKRSFFTKMHTKGRKCAAAAFHWMRELYFAEAYVAAKHRLSLNENHGLQNAIYYMDDTYPDSYVLQDAESLRLQYAPDFLLIHTMGVDHAGHMHGGTSDKYRQAVRNIDLLLAKYMPLWLAENYMIIVTSDHGMHADGAHNDTLEEVRSVPYWILQEHLPFSQKCITSQQDWYAYLCEIFTV